MSFVVRRHCTSSSYIGVVRRLRHRRHRTSSYVVGRSCTSSSSSHIVIVGVIRRPKSRCTLSSYVVVVRCRRTSSTYIGEVRRLRHRRHRTSSCVVVRSCTSSSSYIVIVGVTRRPKRRRTSSSYIGVVRRLRHLYHHLRHYHDHHHNKRHQVYMISRALSTAVVQMSLQSIFPVISESLHHQEGSKRVGKILLRIFHCLYAVPLKVFCQPATSVTMPLISTGVRGGWSVQIDASSKPQCESSAYVNR